MERLHTIWSIAAVFEKTNVGVRDLCYIQECGTLLIVENNKKKTLPTVPDCGP